jgi:XTP/dITP diphosphohydrolase
MRKPSPLLIATTNPGKIRELRAIFSGALPYLRTLAEFAEMPEAEETGATFAENAVIKARHYALHTGLWTLADDSGLEVEALGGAPGVYSARYGGKEASYAERMSRLLGELDGAATRRARFVCVLALAEPEQEATLTFLGECTGSIANRPRGSGGFGYDPIFVPDGYNQTFGEMTPHGKKLLCHRSRAAEQLCRYLQAEFSSSA